jgi:cell division protein ZapA
MAKQPVRVHVFNQSYTMLADGDPREVEEIAHQVDELMASIAGHSSTGDSTRVAVLACFHLADRLRSAEQRLQAIE